MPRVRFFPLEEKGANHLASESSGELFRLRERDQLLSQATEQCCSAQKPAAGRLAGPGLSPAQRQLPKQKKLMTLRRLETLFFFFFFCFLSLFFGGGPQHAKVPMRGVKW